MFYTGGDVKKPGTCEEKKYILQAVIAIVIRSYYRQKN